MSVTVTWYCCLKIRVATGLAQVLQSRWLVGVQTQVLTLALYVKGMGIGKPTGVLISRGPLISGSGLTVMGLEVVSLQPTGTEDCSLKVYLPGLKRAVGLCSFIVCPLPKSKPHLMVS